MVLTFEPVAHRYAWNGEHVPSVTQVLEPLFDWSRISPAVLERKRQIGSAVHAAIHLELTGGVDPDTIDPACKPYFDAWKLFCSECDFEPVLVEYRVYHEALRFAGTLDEWGFLQGEAALIDWKTTLFLHREAVGAQTAAYLVSLARSGIGSTADKRFALKLGRNGRYQLERFRSLDDDWARFERHLSRWAAA